ESTARLHRLGGHLHPELTGHAIVDRRTQVAPREAAGFPAGADAGRGRDEPVRPELGPDRESREGGTAGIAHTETRADLEEIDTEPRLLHRIPLDFARRDGDQALDSQRAARAPRTVADQLGL